MSIYSYVSSSYSYKRQNSCFVTLHPYDYLSLQSIYSSHIKSSLYSYVICFCSCSSTYSSRVKIWKVETSPNRVGLRTQNLFYENSSPDWNKQQIEKINFRKNLDHCQNNVSDTLLHCMHDYSNRVI